MLQNFESDLEKLIGKPTELRPFVCEGSPLECKIFIVGFNPATELSRSFWSFWQPGYGFQKTEWFKIYKQERRDKPLSPGKTRRNEISNTRRIIEWITGEATSIKCLETNIYSLPTKQARDLRKPECATEPFDFLLKTIQPEIIVSHGRDAIKHFETMYNIRLELDNLQPVKTEWGQVKIMPVQHLSRGWSEKRARELGQFLQAKRQSENG